METEKDEEIRQTQAEHQPAEKKSRSLLLSFLQIGACLLILAAAGVIRLIGGTIYSTSASWFYDNYNNQVFTQSSGSILPFNDPVKVTEVSIVSPKIQTDSTGKVRGSFIRPAEGSITRKDDGIEIAVSPGSEIKAAANGIASKAGEDSKLGKYIIISHADGLSSLYAHCGELFLSQGDKCSAGMKIASAGKEALYFEFRSGNTAQDPMSIFSMSSGESQ